MKKVKIAVIILFFALLLLPVLLFNREKQVVSSIDNRVLAESMFGNSEDMAESIEIYIDDRIGLRTSMIRAYTQINDVLFHEMVNPVYTYGKDGYIFLRSGGNFEYWDFHTELADMIARIQQYCEDRDVPFLFAFEPSKCTVLQDELESGTNYDNSWKDRFFEELDKRGVNYVDNTELLEEKTQAGEVVFNKQYDAGHWDDLGAFYGVNNILEHLKEQEPYVHINDIEEFDVSYDLVEMLPLSETSIQDEVPAFSPKTEPENITDLYDAEVERDEQNNFFAYYVNEDRLSEGSPKALVFQGSYINGVGQKFFANSLGEYIAVHDYYNIAEFDYYYNIFKPDCVIFEMAEYTATQEYFPYDMIAEAEFNPCCDTFSEFYRELCPLEEAGLRVEPGRTLTVIKAEGIPEDTEYAYLLLDGEEFDLIRREDGFSVTVENKKAETSDISVITVGADDLVTIYSD